MEEIDWYRDLNALASLVGIKVKIDGNEPAGRMLMVFGGPEELFYMIQVEDKLVYIDVKDSHSIDLIP